MLEHVNKRSIRANREFGGFILEKEGKYYSTRPVKGNKTSFKPSSAKHKIPNGFKVVGDYHTHGADIIGYDNNVFSIADKKINDSARVNNSNHTSYLGTPSDGFKKMNKDGITKLDYK